MLALIEQRMCTDDRKVWARHLENSGKEAILAQLIAWMDTEMKSRMRATAPLRCTGQPARHPVGHIGSELMLQSQVSPTSVGFAKIQVIGLINVRSLSRSVQKIGLRREGKPRLLQLLKRAGRDHKSSNCSRRRQCPEKSNGNQCPYYHHPLLHGAIQSTVATVSSVNYNQKALLPIVQVDIVGSGRLLQRANALLDSGAQISLIRSSVAEDLKLKGKDIVVTITKVGGQEEELSTKNYQVRIRSLEDRSARHTSNRNSHHQRGHHRCQDCRRCKTTWSRKRSATSRQWTYRLTHWNRSSKAAHVRNERSRKRGSPSFTSRLGGIRSSSWRAVRGKSCLPHQA